MNLTSDFFGGFFSSAVSTHKIHFLKKKAFYFLPLRLTVQVVRACTRVILAPSKITKQFNYLLLKLDKYFLSVALQRPSQHMNRLTLEMTLTWSNHLFVYPGTLTDALLSNRTLKEEI